VAQNPTMHRVFSVRLVLATFGVLLLVSLLVPSLVSAFTLSGRHAPLIDVYANPRCRRFASFSSQSEDQDSTVQEEGGLAPKKADAASAAPVAVKCPDCDMCDGSGRYVRTLSSLFHVL